jgi:hypothetical protein
LVSETALAWVFDLCCHRMVQVWAVFIGISGLFRWTSQLHSMTEKWTTHMSPFSFVWRFLLSQTFFILLLSILASGLDLFFVVPFTFWRKHWFRLRNLLIEADHFWFVWVIYTFDIFSLSGL